MSFWIYFISLQLHTLVIAMIFPENEIPKKVGWVDFPLLRRLMSAFGQDTLDALFWTATEPRGKKREHFGVLFHLIVATAYVALHSTIVLLQALTLNVAINSDNKGLLTIVISNNVSIWLKLILESFRFFFFSSFFSIPWIIS